MDPPEANASGVPGRAPHRCRRTARPSASDRKQQRGRARRRAQSLQKGHRGTASLQPGVPETPGRGTSARRQNILEPRTPPVRDGPRVPSWCRADCHLVWVGNAAAPLLPRGAAGREGARRAGAARTSTSGTPPLASSSWPARWAPGAGSAAASAASPPSSSGRRPRCQRWPCRDH